MSKTYIRKSLLLSLGHAVLPILIDHLNVHAHANILNGTHVHHLNILVHTNNLDGIQKLTFLKELAVLKEVDIVNL